MPIVPHQIDQALYLLRSGRLEEIGKRITSRFYEEWISYGLRKDIALPFPIPKARIPITIRELHPNDIPILLPTNTHHLDRKEQREIAIRRAHVEANIPTCYVAVDARNNTPCFMQWLMGPDQNQAIQNFFDGRFPLLKADEALLENAYTPVEYRGKGIMPTAMALIAGRAIELGCRTVITFVAHDNIPSLKACVKAGFTPYLKRRDARSFFHLFKRREFIPLPEGFSLPFGRTSLTEGGVEAQQHIQPGH